MMTKIPAIYSLKEDLIKVRCLQRRGTFQENKVYLARHIRVTRLETGKEEIAERLFVAYDEEGKHKIVSCENSMHKRVFAIVEDGEYSEDEFATYPEGFNIMEHIITRDEISKMWIYRKETSAFLRGKIDPRDRVGDELMIGEEDEDAEDEDSEE